MISVHRMSCNKHISLVYILLVTPSMAPKVGHDNGDIGSLIADLVCSKFARAFVGPVC